MEQSTIITESYNQKAENSLLAAKVLYKKNLLEESTTMSYYAMYHQLTALLRRVGIQCENHTASILLLQELFDINSEDIQQAKKQRVHKQYYTDTTTNRKHAKKQIELAQRFIEHIGFFIDTLNQEKVESYVKKMIKTYFKRISTKNLP